MLSQTIMIQNPHGLHARPAGELVKIATSCDSDITLIVGERRINAKSIFSIMSAGIKCGTQIEIECSGETEKEDLDCLLKAIEQGLGE
ncbi:HPr family phosphocarrier protein [Candidatus Galacturonibacter soehngenii]|uniref:HPr family phosphocarrier protein n=1 Tax=Candidatus Galacturonatibacter soehngenii TaxID=2307010 RepID=A0A7V7QKJ4_9FIRM|nr:HPr family phosphocarrier protein [Candidatus Galacturonibacter soehngenii]KAB1437956.1 HPr family phosphocarrier protein [Candidatus Galacturonibacter soehngenii]